MSDAATVPMFDPNGQVHDVPQEQVNAAVANGGRQATRMTAPDGVVRFVPNDQVNAALSAGGKLADSGDSGVMGWMKRTFSPRTVPGTGLPQSFGDFAQRAQGAPNPGSFEGQPQNIGEWVPQTAGNAISGVQDIAHGNVARGGTELLSAVSNAALPVAPFVAAAAPIQTAANIGLSYAAGKATGAGAALLGANPEQQQFAEAAGSYAIPMAGSALMNRFGPSISRTLNNAVVTPAAKDFQFGKNPSGALADEGIIGASKESVLGKVILQKQAIGQQIGDILANSPAKSIDIDQTVGDVIDAEMAKAISNGDQNYVNQLRDIRERWTHTFTQDQQGNVVPQARLTNVNPTVANELKQRIGDDSNWNEMTNPYAQPLNKLQVRVYRSLNNAIEDAAPGTRALNSRYGNLLTAEKGLRRGQLNDMRAQAPSGMSILTSPVTTPLGTAGATTLASGASADLPYVSSPLIPRAGLAGQDQQNDFGADMIRRYLGLD